VTRRQFISLLGGAAAWPAAARAQQAALPVVGFLHTRSSYAPAIVAFQKGLREAGFVEGQTVGIDYRWADGRYDQLAAMAADLVGRKVSVLVAGGGEPSPLAAKAATSTIPIVFVVGSDPVKAGLVASYNRPGGNITGMNILTDTLEAKRLGLLHELVPHAATIGFLVNPRFASAVSQLEQTREAAHGLALAIYPMPVSTEGEIEVAFGTISRQRILALAVGADPFLDTYRDKIIALAAQHAVPAMYQFREHAIAGGLVSYGVDIFEAWSQVGAYTARILKGEKPANLPVLQPTKFELVINLKTAKTLGLAVPDKLLALAVEVTD
jgi:putative ABC transport system substrate-binding protein